MLDKDSTKEKEYNKKILNLKKDAKQALKVEKSKELAKNKNLKIEKEEMFTRRENNRNDKKKYNQKMYQKVMN